MPNLRNAAIYAFLGVFAGAIAVRLFKRTPTWHRHEPSFEEPVSPSDSSAHFDDIDPEQMRYISDLIYGHPASAEWSVAKALRPSRVRTVMQFMQLGQSPSNVRLSYRRDRRGLRSRRTRFGQHSVTSSLIGTHWPTVRRG